MAIDITSRHIEVEENVKNHAHERAEKIVSEFPRVESVHVVLDCQKYRQIAEVIVQAKNHVRVEASEAADDMFKAIDIAMERVEKQLRRARQKVQQHRANGIAEVELESQALEEESVQ